MRDDLKMLFPNLAKLYKKKFDLLNDLFTRQIEARYRLEANDVDSVLNSVSYDNYIIEQINALDYDISHLNDKIRAMIGLKPQDYDDIINNNPDFLIVSIKKMREEIGAKMVSIANERDGLLKSMKEKADELSKDIGDLSIMKNLIIIKE